MNIKDLIKGEIERKTELGLKLENIKDQGEAFTIELQTKIVRTIIYRHPCNKKFLLTDFLTTLEDFKYFEANCCKIKHYFSFHHKEQKPLPEVNFKNPEIFPQSYYFIQGKFASITERPIDLINSYIAIRNHFGFVLGASFSEKSVFAKRIEKFGGKLIDFEIITNKLKEKLGGEDGPLEELPYNELVKVNLYKLKL